MKKIITNNYNLKEKDITEIVKRVKVILINCKNEIILGYSNNEYQFPGGHVEEGENLIDAVKREIKEETGIELELNKLKPFACLQGYYKDWPSIGKNRKTEIYYYEIKTDKLPNINNTKYTEKEIEGNYELRFIPIEKVENEITDNTKTYEDKHGIAKEMLEVFKIYKNIKKEV